METIELGRTGQHVSKIALGAMQMGNATDERDSVRILDRYRELGGSFIDTADCYEWWSRPGSHGGESEQLLGRWMREGNKRDDVFLATKGSGMPRFSDRLWHADGTPDWGWARENFSGAGAATLREALDGSLRRLGTDHVDLYYIHVDDRGTPLEETLEVLAGFVQAGKVRYLGWSNVRTWRLERIRGLCARHGWPLPVAVQQQHTYLRPKPGLDSGSIVDGEQLDYLREHDDQTLVAYSPIAKGLYDQPERLGEHRASTFYGGPDAERRLAAVTEVAAALGATPNQVVLAWLLRQRAPRVVPLVGPRTPEQFENLIGALDVKLDDDSLARLADV